MAKETWLKGNWIREKETLKNSLTTTLLGYYKVSMHFLFKIPSLEKGVKKYQKNLMGQSNYTPSFEENTINNHDKW